MADPCTTNWVLGTLVGSQVVVLVAAQVMFRRNHLIHTVRSKALHTISDKCQKAILEGRPWKPYYEMFEKGASYDRQLWQFGKKKFEDFYPDLAE